jgi:hypothetical protein
MNFMLLGSLHILSVPMIMHVNSFFPSRSVRMLPSACIRTTVAPFPTASGAADRAWAMYSESEDCVCCVWAAAAITNAHTTVTKTGFSTRMSPPTVIASVFGSEPTDKISGNAGCP